MPGLSSPLGSGGGGGGSTSLLLDTIGGAYAAYSLRKLRSEYAGNAALVRRSSDGATQGIGFSNGEFDAAAFAAFIGAGNGYTATLYDQSGNGLDASAPNSGAQPPLVLNAHNSKTLLNFQDAVSTQQLVTVPLPRLVICTIYAVVVTGAARNFNPVIYAPSEGTYPVRIWQPPFTSNTWRASVRSDVDSATQAPGTTYLLACKYDGATLTFFVNGTNVGSVASTYWDNVTLGLMWLGSSGNTPPDNVFTGYMGEWLVFPSAHSNSVMSAVFSDINTYYALY